MTLAKPADDLDGLGAHSKRRTLSFIRRKERGGSGLTLATSLCFLLHKKQVTFKAAACALFSFFI